MSKQIGVVGENKRTDLMGLLLLVSPPGYGKTTLMEYIASRLGINLIEMASGVEREKVNFEGTYSIDELNEYIGVIEKLFIARDIVLKVNMEYIYSASQADEYRKEPPK